MTSIDVLKRYEIWEAKLIETDECWRFADGLPKLTNELWEELIEIQCLRNEVLEKSNKTGCLRGIKDIQL